MKRFLFAAALAIATIPSLAAEDSISLSLGQPGFYGRLDIGGYPRPQLIYRQPILIDRVGARRPPVYLHVPPRHAKNWRKYCRAYNACGERVYFVQERWYKNEYVPRYQERHGDRRDGGRYRDDRYERRQRDDRPDRPDRDRERNYP